MKKSLIAAVVVLCLIMIAVMAVPAMASQPEGKPVGSNNGQIRLYEKDPTLPIADETIGFPIVEDGAWGILNYSLDDEGMISGVFNGKGLDAGMSYTLIAYGDSEGEPWPSAICLGEATANNGGNVHIAVAEEDISNAYREWNEYEYTGLGGIKVWLVLTSNVSGNAMTDWNPTEYLFEGDLINKTELP